MCTDCVETVVRIPISKNDYFSQKKRQKNMIAKIRSIFFIGCIECPPENGRINVRLPRQRTNTFQLSAKWEEVNRELRQKTAYKIFKHSHSQMLYNGRCTKYYFPRVNLLDTLGNVVAETMTYRTTRMDVRTKGLKDTLRGLVSVNPATFSKRDVVRIAKRERFYMSTYHLEYVLGGLVLHLRNASITGLIY